MCDTPGMDWSEEVRVKEELEIGPTVIKPATVCYPTSVKVECSEDVDYSEPFTSGIKFEDDSDDGSRTSPSELLPGESVPVSTYCGDGTVGRGSEDASTSGTHEVSSVQWAPDVQARARASPEHRCGAPPEPEGLLEAAAREDCLTPHTTAEKLTCEILSGQFKYLRNEQIDTRKRPFACEICNYKFSRAGNLERHKLTHTGERQFECEICNATFTRKDHLKSHNRLHTGEKPFECEICNAKFAQAGSLKSHKRTHTGERPFECEICSARFAVQSNLKTHKITHTGEKPFECEICNAKFRNAGILKMHKRTHTGERRFKCEICNAKFAEAGTLTKHKRTHTGERPYECEICYAKFTQAGSLKRHKRTHY